mmetsp:Transcript_21597/g.63386  ORF Transcript_21597/g.63386 Transcript_21597/m.63386 type:complete len:207 (+) Transcript_21597:9-629(+)
MPLVERRYDASVMRERDGQYRSNSMGGTCANSIVSRRAERCREGRSGEPFSGMPNTYGRRRRRRRRRARARARPPAHASVLSRDRDDESSKKKYDDGAFVRRSDEHIGAYDRDGRPRRSGRSVPMPNDAPAIKEGSRRHLPPFLRASPKWTTTTTTTCLPSPKNGTKKKVPTTPPRHFGRTPEKIGTGRIRFERGPNWYTEYRSIF